MMDTDALTHEFALAYARTKLAALLNRGFEFKDYPASTEIEELVYLTEMYAFAVSYFDCDGSLPDDLNRLIQEYRENKRFPPRPNQEEE